MQVSSGTEVHVRTVELLTAMLARPVMQNNFRAWYSEAQVGILLGEEWVSAGADWGSFDFLHPATGTTLEVKSSAAKQSWKQRGPSTTTFDIAPRRGFFVDGDDLNEWHEYAGGAQRAADIYVFTWHPIFDGSCDQRDERQWEYFVAPTERLPISQKTIRLSALRSICSAANCDSLRRWSTASCATD